MLRAPTCLVSSETGGQSPPLLTSSLEFSHCDPMLPGSPEAKEEDLLSFDGFLMSDGELPPWTHYLGLNDSAEDIFSATALEAPIMTLPQSSF